jgi:hypothetical protein
MKYFKQMIRRTAFLLLETPLWNQSEVWRIQVRLEGK